MTPCDGIGQARREAVIGRARAEERVAGRGTSWGVDAYVVDGKGSSVSRFPNQQYFDWTAKSLVIRPFDGQKTSPKARSRSGTLPAPG